ncbi:MAG: hypothetical protein JXA09_10685 [Anaerolineae bacterium]|nr:hypothetical protein [Anaerolineae bacterium]
MDAREQRHVSYLLRMWQVHDGKESHWRASLEGMNGEERIGFAGLDALCAYLRWETGLPPAPEAERCNVIAEKGDST